MGLLSMLKSIVPGLYGWKKIKGIGELLADLDFVGTNCEGEALKVIFQSDLILVYFIYENPASYRYIRLPDITNDYNFIEIKDSFGIQEIENNKVFELVGDSAYKKALFDDNESREKYKHLIFLGKKAYAEVISIDPPKVDVHMAKDNPKSEEYVNEKTKHDNL